MTVQYSDCVSSFDSAGPSASQMANAVLRFSTQQVNTVMFVSNYEGTLLLMFSQAADHQAYRPVYLLTSAAQVAGFQSALPPGQLPQMSGWGWMPVLDRTRGNTAVTGPERACIKRLTESGKQVQSTPDYVAAYWACDGFAALEAALIGSLGDSSADTLLPALDSRSSSLNLASIVDGQIMTTGRRHDGPSRVQRFTYQAKCSCFDYTGASEAMSS